MGNTIVFKISLKSKILKKIQHLAFTDKVKVIKAFVPEKVKLLFENKLEEELKYFSEKILFLKLKYYLMKN